jgi:hypothetical protein
MCAGIAVGAGNKDPEMRGMATGARVHIRQYVSTLPGTLPLHQDSTVLVFSSSYSNGCNAGYTSTTRMVDQEIYNNPSLMQVFSAGNSNNANCGYGAGSEWGNVTGGHKVGKNVIATANLMANDLIASSSSRGPAADGRIKPDIGAHGANHWSTDPNNEYNPGGGTSAAAPGIAGVFTQLNHAFKQLHGDTLAPSALLKLILLNTATDLGNDGPDFIYGWGKVNAFRAVRTLEDGRYFGDSISQGDTITHSIDIPNGVRRAKIMVYWADKEGSLIATYDLVNDLNCVVKDSSSNVYYPWLLDHSPNVAALSSPATTGIDSINNMEQIAIDNPQAGQYTLEIHGTVIPFGAQKYYVAYEFLTDEVSVIYPAGGEGLIPGDFTRVYWDAFGGSSTFHIEYSLDGGSTWSNIAANAPASARSQTWTVPNAISGQAMVRVSRDTLAGVSQAQFSIMDRPDNLDVETVCFTDTSFTIRWDSVPGATSYDVFLLGNKYMDSIATTSATSYTIYVPNLMDVHWYSVRARGANGLRSMRQIAEYLDLNIDCVLGCGSDDDAGIRNISSPDNFISPCGGLTTVPVSVQLENIGLTNQTGFSVSYQLNGNNVVTETYSGTLNANSSSNFTFSTPLSIPPQGAHVLKIWTSLATDLTPCNDTIFQSIDVKPGTVSAPFTEDLEGGTFPPAQGYVVNPDEEYTWEARYGVTGASGNSTTTMAINNYSYNAPAEEDYFYTVPIDLTSALSAQLSFDVSYRPYSASYSDRLRVDVSDDCGQSFSPVYFKQGLSLATGTYYNSTWTPTSASDWRNDVVDLTNYVGSDLIIRFVNINGYGNHMFIDNISVDVSTIGINENSTTFGWSLYPNPTKGVFSIRFNTSLEEDVHLRIFSLDGRVVHESLIVKNTRTTSIDVKGLAHGVYHAELGGYGVSEGKRLIIIE